MFLFLYIFMSFYVCTLYFTSSFTQTVLFGDHARFLQYVQDTYMYYVNAIATFFSYTFLVSGAAKTAGNLSCIACQEGLKLGMTFFE